ncbi:MAG: hypothetical protein MJ160_03880 [Treponema sp.]|nr:hypothetical protein [Treponema sp.]
MAKKAKLPLIYLVGMALIVIGFCCPVFKGVLSSSNGFSFLNFDHFGFVTIGGLLILAGGVLGLLSCFVPALAKYRLIWAILSVAGGVILVIGFNDSWLSKLIGKGFLKAATYGFYMIIAGWIASVAGAVLKK